MNARETISSLLNQALSQFMAAYDAKCAECDAKDRTIAELRTALDEANRENAFLRGDLDEPLSQNETVEIGEGHVMKPVRIITEGEDVFEEAECERCNGGYKKHKNGPVIACDDIKLSKPCTGERDEQ